MPRIIRISKKKNVSTSPMQRSLKLMRDLRYKPAITEHWNPHAGIRQDLYGIGDILCYRAGTVGSIMIQATSSQNHMARIYKVLASEHIEGWLLSSNRFQVQSWGSLNRRISSFSIKDGIISWKDMDLPDDDL